MNQNPAAILVLASSILAFAATSGTSITTATNGVTTHASPIGMLVGLGSLVLGIWGVISLIGASLRDREPSLDGNVRQDLLAMFDPRRTARPQGVPLAAPVATSPIAPATTDTAGISLSPEVKAQLSMASHLEGRERSEIIEEALRRHLPRFETPKAA